MAFITYCDVINCPYIKNALAFENRCVNNTTVNQIVFFSRITIQMHFLALLTKPFYKTSVKRQQTNKTKHVVKDDPIDNFISITHTNYVNYISFMSRGIHYVNCLLVIHL